MKDVKWHSLASSSFPLNFSHHALFILSCFCVAPLRSFWILLFTFNAALANPQSTIIIQSNRILCMWKKGNWFNDIIHSVHLIFSVFSAVQAMAQISTWTLVDLCTCVEVDNNHSQLQRQRCYQSKSKNK